MSRSSRLAIALALGTAMILMLALAIVFVEGVSVVLAEDQPDGSIIISPQTVDGTWGPGTITAETDVVINAGVVITIAPGTTIRVADGVGFTVYGNLHSDGPVTFTAISAAPGAWEGIAYAPDGSGYLNRATVEYAVHALTLDTSNPITISNSHLRHNLHQTSGSALAYGAGLYIVQGDHLIQSTRIYGNAVTASNTGQVRGAGVYIVGGAPRILDSWIYENTATGNRAGAGGGIAMAGGAATIEGSHIVTNTLTGSGNVQLKSGGGIGFAGYTSAVVRGSWIAANRNALNDGYAGGGGIGFGNRSSASLIESNVIYGNYIQGPDWCEGGGIDTWDTTNSAIINNNLIISNTSGTCRSGYGAYGGGVNMNGSSTGVYVVNNTIVGNQAERGGGLYLQGGTVVALNNVIVNNSASNRGGGVQRDTGTADYNDIFGNTSPTGANWNGSVGGNNTSVDPMFLGTGDLVQQYHLHPWSPVIDAGTNSATGLPDDDYDSDLRPMYGGWDMGFDEVAPAFTVTKIAVPDLVRPGETLNYTIVIANVGRGDATGLAVSDPLPANTTYVPGSSRVTIPILQSETYRDELTNVAFDGSDGTLDWSSQPWSEIGDDGRPDNGDVRIVTDQGDRSIRIANNGNGMMRMADLSSYTSARFTFEYRRHSFDGDSDYVRVEVSSDGGSSWTELALIGGSITDSGYKSASYDVTDYIAANTAIRFVSSGLGGSDYFYVDNVQIRDFSYQLSTSPGGAPPTLVSGARLGAGQSMTITYTVLADSPMPAGIENIFNTVDVDNDQGVTASETITTPVEAAPDLTLDKDDGGITATPGSVVVYTLSYANGGTQGASGVAITETVPANATFDAGGSTGTWGCADGSPAGTVCVLSIGGLDAGDGGTVDFAVTVDAPLPAGVEEIENLASIADDGVNGTDLTPDDNTGDDATPVEAAPDLTLDKDDGGIVVTPGSTVVYTLSYLNGGTQGASGVVITETVPANVTFDAGNSTGTWSCADGSPAGTVCVLSIGGLDTGEEGTVDFAVTVDAPLPAGVEEIENVASIADDGANGTDLTPDDNTDDDATPVEAAPDLALDKDDGGAAVIPGGVVTYVLSYLNGGTQGASGVAITETVPANATFDAGGSTGTWGCADGSPAGTVCVLSIGGLDAGDGGTVDFAVTVDAPLPAGVEEIENLASIADDGANGTDLTPDDNADDDATPVVGAAPDLVIAKSDGDISTLPGRVVVYTLDYANNGNQNTAGVVITETVPNYTTFRAEGSSVGWGCADGSPAGTVCTLAVGSLDAGYGSSVTFAVTVSDPIPDSVGYISNVVSIAGNGANGIDLNPNDNEDEDVTPIGYTPVLNIVKAGPDVASVGETVIYTFTVSHDAASDGTPVYNVIVNDDVAGAATLISGDEGDDGLLEAGETWVFAASYTIQSDDPNPLIDTGIAEGRDEEGDTVTASDTHSTVIEGEYPSGFHIFLPIILRNQLSPVPESMPDLVVESVTVTGSDVRVVIKNQGSASVTDAFWVDLYVSPDPIPTGVNQVWNDGRSPQGIVWGVAGGILPLDPGASLTLAYGDIYYWPSLSNIALPLSEDAPIYVQVDSANTDTTYGAVLESHEISGEVYNNIYGPTFPTTDVVSEGPVKVEGHSTVWADLLPPRP